MKVWVVLALTELEAAATVVWQKDLKLMLLSPPVMDSGGGGLVGKREPFPEGCFYFHSLI